MKRAHHPALVFAFILALLAPAMTCALPGTSMNAQDRACCHEMQGHCAGAGMPASHSCCHENLASGVDAVQPHAVAVPGITVVAILPAALHFDICSVPYARVNCDAHAPALSPPSTVSELRI
jgi:hypothetical protein